MEQVFITKIITLFKDEQYFKRLLSPLTITPSEFDTELLEEPVVNNSSNSIEAPEVTTNRVSDVVENPAENEEDFTEEYFTESEFNIEIFNTLNSNFNTSAEEIFELLNASILHGEYFSIQDFEPLKNDLLDSSNQFIRKAKEEAVHQGQYYNSLTIYFRVVSTAINDFINFITGINEKVKASKKVYYTINADNNLLVEEYKFTIEPEFANSWHILQINSLNLYRLFKINLNASRNEFLMQSNDFERLLAELLLDIKWIDSKTDLALSDAIKAKSHFLWLKIKFRIIEDSNNKVFFSDGVNEIHFHLENDPFKEWIKTFKRHYDISDDSKERTISITKEKNLITQAVKDVRNLIDLHLLIKYYKDCTDNNYQKELSEIRKEISERYITVSRAVEKSKFDIFALSFAYNYSINNEFSALLSEENVQHSAVKSLYDEICQVQELTSIDNFFPQWMYLKYIIKKIKNDLKTDIKTHDLGNISKLLQEARSIFSKYDKNIYWTQNTYNYIFYLPYKECFVEFIDSKNIISRIFVASSFNLPLVRNKYVLDFSKAEIELSNLERSVEVITLINDEQKRIKETNDALSSEIKNKETKYIEILGIFGAVITFASAAFTTGLASVDNVNSDKLLMGLISIGIVLFLFIVLLLFVTRIPIEKLWSDTEKLGLRKLKHALTIGVLTLIITVMFNFVYINYLTNKVFKPKTSTEQKELPRLKLDTIKASITLNNSVKINDTTTRVDSIKKKQPKR